MMLWEKGGVHFWLLGCFNEWHILRLREDHCVYNSDLVRKWDVLLIFKYVVGFEENTMWLCYSLDHFQHDERQGIHLVLWLGYGVGPGYSENSMIFNPGRIFNFGSFHTVPHNIGLDIQKFSISPGSHNPRSFFMVPPPTQPKQLQNPAQVMPILAF